MAPPPLVEAKPAATPEPASDPAAATAAPAASAPAAKPGRSGTLVLGGVAAVLLLGGGFFAWQTYLAAPTPPPPPVTKKAAPVAATPPPAATPAATPNAPTTTPGKAVQKAKAVVAAHAANVESEVIDPIANQPAQAGGTAAPQPKTSEPAAVAGTGVTKLAPGVSATTALQVVADASPAFRSFVANAKISGVVGGGGGRPAAALINGRLTRAGDTLDSALGIVLDGVDVEKRQLVFKDKSGASVARRY